jgi:hypothetical protein
MHGSRREVRGVWMYYADKAARTLDQEEHAAAMRH